MTSPHFVSNDDIQSVINERIFFSSSLSDNRKSKPICPSVNMKDVLQQLWALMKWQALITVRKYFKSLLQLLLPVLCVIFYGYSVGNDMNEVNLGIGKICELLCDSKIYLFFH